MNTIPATFRTRRNFLFAYLTAALLASSAHGTSPQYDIYQRSGPRRNWNSPIQIVPVPPKQALAAAPSLAVAPRVPLAVGATPTLALDPPSIAGDFRDYADVQIAGLETGEAVRLEKFQVNNTSGLVDASAVLVESLLLIDGQAAVIGGVTDHNVTADLTPADGAIIAELSFLDAFLPSMAGEYVFRLSSPNNRFTPVSTRFTVTPVPAAQQVSGTVTAGGANVPYAYVALFDVDGGSYDFVAGTVADAQGAYAIPAPPGSYHLLEARPGFVSSFGASPNLVRLTAGMSGVVNPELTAGTRTVSGRLCDAANPALGLPGVQLLLRNSEQTRLAITYSDAAGNWSAVVTPDEWEVEVLAWSVTQIGYVGLLDSLFADTTGGNASNVTICLPRADALIRGTVADNGTPLPFVDVVLYSQDFNYWLTTSTDENGEYTAAVSAGGWNVALDAASLEFLDYAGVAGSLVPLTAGAVVTADFAPLANTTYVEGSVVDELGDPVPGASFTVIDVSGSSQSFVAGEADEDGAFFISLPDGVFRFQISLETLAEYDLMEVRGAPIVTTGDDLSGVELLMKNPTAHLTVHVIDQFGQPVTDVPLLARSVIGGAEHRGLDFTDEDGDARLPVVNGAWTLELNSANELLRLENYGYLAPTNPVIPIAGGDLTHSLTLTLILPRLEITRATASAVKLTWATPVSGFVLESATSLSGPWLPEANTPAFFNGNYSLTVPMAQPAMFFRLRRP